MATNTQKPDKLNPGDTHWDDELNNGNGPIISSGDASDLENRPTLANNPDSLSSIRDSERSAESPDSIRDKNDVSSSENSVKYTPTGGKKSGKKRFSGNRKKSFAIIAILAGLLGGGGFITLFLLPGVALVNFKEVYTDRFSSRIIAAAEERSVILHARKIKRDVLSSGCSTAVPIKCRFVGMSGSERRKLQSRANVTVNTDGRYPNGKLRVSSVTYTNSQGQRVTVTADEFSQRLRSDPKLVKDFRQLYKPKVMVWADKSARGLYGVYKVFRGKSPPPADNADIDRQTGQEQRDSRIRQHFRKIVSGEQYDIDTTTARTSPSADDTEAERQNKEEINRIQEQFEDQTREQVEQTREALEDPTKPLEPIPKIGSDDTTSKIETVRTALRSTASRAILGAFLGPLAAADTACTAKKLVSGVGYAAKLIASQQLIRYAIEFNRIADSIKFGDVNADEVEYAGTILSRKDPETGKTAFDSFGYQYAAYGTVGNVNDSIQYRLGGGLSGSLIAIGNKIDAVLGRSKCSFIQNPFVQGAAIAVGVVVAVFTGGGSAAAGAALGAASAALLVTAAQIAAPMLARMIAGGVVSGDESGEDAGNAAAAGMGAASEGNAKSRGLPLLTKSEAVAQDPQVTSTMATIAKFDTTSQFDVTNPYSFAGKVATSLLPSLQSSSPGSAIASLGSAALRSLSTVSGIASAADPGREYEICQDVDYKEKDIATDPWCNPQRGVSSGIINSPEYTTEKILNYMAGETGSSDEFVSADGEPQGDFAEYVENCVQSTDPIGTETDPNCFKKDKKHTMFYMYCFDASINEGKVEQSGDEDEETGGSCSREETSPPTDSTPSGDTESTAGTEIVGNVDEPSDSVACADGTRDVGVHDGYRSGTLIKIRLCALPNIKSTSEESTAGSSHYIDGANGDVLVNSRVSGAWYSLIQAAKSDGLNLAANSSFRSMAHQQALFNGNPNPALVARPGNSPHQSGLAIDFNGTSIKNPGAQTCSSRVRDPGSPVWQWLYDNSERFGFRQYSAESWHWDPWEMSNRCGK